MQPCDVSSNLVVWQRAGPRRLGSFRIFFLAAFCCSPQPYCGLSRRLRRSSLVPQLAASCASSPLRCHGDFKKPFSPPQPFSSPVPAPGFLLSAFFLRQLLRAAASPLQGGRALPLGFPASHRLGRPAKLLPHTPRLHPPPGERKKLLFSLFFFFLFYKLVARGYGAGRGGSLATACLN